jgi:hypothetical protein
MESTGVDPEYASARLLSHVDGMRIRELARDGREYDVLVQRSEKCHGVTLGEVRNNVKKRAFELEEEGLKNRFPDTSEITGWIFVLTGRRDSRSSHE